MDAETTILLIAVMGSLEAIIAVGIWRLLRWAKSGAIRREIGYMLKDDEMRAHMSEVISNVNIDIEGAMRSYLDEPIEISIEGKKQAIPRIQALVFMGARVGAASAFESFKAWLHGAGVKDSDVAGAIQGAARLKGGVGKASGLITEDGELDIAAGIDMIVNKFLGGEKNSGKVSASQQGATSGGRIGP